MNGIIVNLIKNHSSACKPVIHTSYIMLTYPEYCDIKSLTVIPKTKEKNVSLSIYLSIQMNLNYESPHSDWWPGSLLNHCTTTHQTAVIAKHSLLSTYVREKNLNVHVVNDISIDFPTTIFFTDNLHTHTDKMNPSPTKEFKALPIDTCQISTQYNTPTLKPPGRPT